MKRGLPAALAVVSGMAGVLFAAMPAQAAGDTARRHGCAAHWRNTAAWNECVNSPGVDLQLQARCAWQDDYYGFWHYVRGTLNPADRYECRHHVESARNAFG